MIQQIKDYALQEQIGKGGFGSVYRAYQTTIKREVAIKVILPTIANHPDFIRRFENEAQIIARLEHLHIVPLYDYWRDAQGAYLVMRWLKNGSLRTALDSEGPFGLADTVQLIDQIASALQSAHRGGVVHRDLKPANILLDEDGNAYLADFGIAKDLTDIKGNNTAEDVIIGSLDYISPEQARSDPVTPRTDIYSLGVVLYETLTGQHPFPNLTSLERLYKHINDPLPLIENPAIPKQINAVIQKATAKNPANRYGDVLEMATAFREAVALNSRTVDDLTQILTLREQEILHWVVKGLSNKEIAEKLTFSISTVKWYINQIYKKLHVRSRVQAIVRARELKLITKDDSSDEPSTVIGIFPIPTEEFQPTNPYKGLRAFQAADYEDFFGQEKLIEKLLKRLAETRDDARFLAVIGPSGSGKSSLIQAGLIPSLWRGTLPGSENWFIIEMLPGSHPLDELEVALSRVAANQTSGLREQLERDSRGLIRATQLILPEDNSELVLVIDQFEEVFTLVEDEAARIHFLDLITTAVTSTRSRIRVIITLRADFYDRPLHYPEIGELIRNRMETILPLSAEGLDSAIARPAERVGVSFETGLIASIIQEIHYQPGALPLLQYALTELFEQRQGHLLTHEAYQAIGKTTGALAKRAEQIYAELPPKLQAAAHQMFLRLVTLGEGVEDTRRRVERSELLAITADPDLMDEVIDTFTAYRLLSLDHNPSSRTPTVEVAHEAILREWERLRAWLNESRHEIRLQRQIAYASGEWNAANQEVSFLLRGSRLELFEKWVKETQLALTPQEQEFLHASLIQKEHEHTVEQNRQQREIQLEKRSRNFLRGLVAVFAIATLIAVGLSIFAFKQRQTAQDNESEAEHNASKAQQVALIAGSQAALRSGDTDQAIALALQAVTLAPNSAPAQAALSEAAYSPGTIHVLEGHTNSVDGVSFSPDGLTALSASWDKSVILWDVQTGNIIRRFEGHIAEATAVVYMPDGLSAVSSGMDGRLIQWNIHTGDIIHRFEEQSEALWTVAVSPDGKYAASGGTGKTVKLWDIQSGDMVGHFEGHTAEIETVVFNADGSQLLSASQDGTLILWEVTTGNILHRFEGHTGLVYSGVFSPDNTMIASSSSDGRAIVWDTETGDIIQEFHIGGDTIDVGFTRDSQSVLTGAIGGGLVLWNMTTGLPTYSLWGHRGTISSLDVNPDGRTAITAAADHTLRIWDLEQGQLIRRLAPRGDMWTAFALSPNNQLGLVAWYSGTQTVLDLSDLVTGASVRQDTLNGMVAAMVFSPDGQAVLLGMDLQGQPSDLILWDVATWQEIRRFSGHSAGIYSLDISPDGHYAISSGYGGEMILWNVDTGQEIRQFVGYENDDFNSNFWTSVTFSPDGKTIAATHFQGDIVLWDVETTNIIRQFEGHENWAFNFVFSTDGKRGFTGSEDAQTILWDVDTGAVLNRFYHLGPITGVDISADGRFGIEGTPGDGGIQLRDLVSGEVIRHYGRFLLTSSLAPDDRTLLGGEWLGPIELWRIDRTLDELLTWLHANRYIPELTCEQRTLYNVQPLCENHSG